MTICEYVKSWLRDIFAYLSRWFLSLKPWVPTYACTAQFYKAKVNPSSSRARYDTDSKVVRIDNCASYSISFDKSDFVSPLVPVKHQIKGLGGTLNQVQKGTISWTIEDDEGQIYVMILPESLYVPQSPSRLLSPQHWAQTSPQDQPWCETHHDEVKLLWKGGKRVKTVTLSKRTGNVATLYTAPGYQAYASFVQGIDATEEQLVAFPNHVISDDEEQNSEQGTQRGQSKEPDSDDTVIRGSREVYQVTDFNLNGPQTTELPSQLPTIIEDEEDSPRLENAIADFLAKHHQLNHLSMIKMQAMAKQGLLPKRWAKSKVPVCTSCLYGKATRRPWRTKPKKGQDRAQLRVATEPGQCISIDQLESRTPGLIAQVKGWLTKKRYTAATVFVDHFSSLSYVYLQTSTNAEETVAAKQSFEAYAERHGVKIRSYQADNGRFAENAFMKEVKDSGQSITFCGVNAHFQNGVAERRIRTLQDQTRTMLIHAQHRWPSAIDAHLWPYALRTANEVFNNAPLTARGDMKSPLELFSKSPVRPNLENFQPFGCPAFVLDHRMQAGQKLPKWQLRARIGVNLGVSNQHARSVALVLNLNTGHVSPQFHIKFDPKFHSVRGSLGNIAPPSKWQVECGFKPRGRIPKTKADKRPEESDLLSQRETEDERPQANEVDEDREQMSDEGPRRSKRLSAKPRVDYVEGNLSSMGVQEMVAFMTIKDDNEGEQAPVAYAASKDPDTMYYHEAMKEPDRDQFRQAMVNEVEAHTKNGVWVLLKKSEVPIGQKIIPSVWAMKRKRRIATREIYKWKARLNIDGSKQEEGVNFWETFAPVASWTTIRLILILTLIYGWDTRQIDFVLAYTQADVECELYMSIPKGFEVEGDEEYVLKLQKNLFGQRQAGRVWNQHLVDRLIKVGFVVSEIDECLFYRGRSVFVLYTDDSILAGPDPKELDQIIQDMKDAELELTVEGGIEDFLGVQIERSEDGKSFNLTQPHLIDDILKELRLDEKNAAKKKTTGASSRPLLRCPTAPSFDGHFDYRRVVGKLNYLEKCTRIDISCATHQCARFVADPKDVHGKAIKWIGRYLSGTKGRGLLMTPDEQRGFEVYVDASFVGDWDPETAEWDDTTAKSRMGYIFLFAGCLMSMGFTHPRRDRTVNYRKRIHRNLQRDERTTASD